MPKRCSVCNHEHRVEIDAALHRGELTRAVSERFDGLSYPQVKGHRRSGHHLLRTPRRRTSPHTAEGLLTRIGTSLGDRERLRALRLAVLTLPPEEKRLLLEGLRRRAGRVEVGVLTRAAAA